MEKLSIIKNKKYYSYKKFNEKLKELLGKSVFLTWEDELLIDSKQKLYVNVETFFNNNRNIKWETIKLGQDHNNKKRMDFRVRQTIVYLHKTCKIKLVCSEKRKRSDGRRKYLCCSDQTISVKEILLLYKLRWKIEIFHKQVKMHLGFEDVSASKFISVQTHVHLVYCSYILLDYFNPTVDEMTSKIQVMKKTFKTKELNEILQVLSQFGGVEKYKQRIRAVIEN